MTKDEQFEEIKKVLHTELDALHAKITETLGEKPATLIKAQVSAKMMCMELNDIMKALDIPDHMRIVIGMHIGQILAHLSAATEQLLDMEPVAAQTARAKYDEVTKRHLAKAEELDAQNNAQNSEQPQVGAPVIPDATQKLFDGNLGDENVNVGQAPTNCCMSADEAEAEAKAA